MGGLHTKLEFTQHGRPSAEGWSDTGVLLAVDHLVSFAKHTRLEATHPWQLAPRSARELENTFGYAPPGGWMRLVALCAGAGWLKAEVNHFAPTGDAHAPPTTAAALSQHLVEAFTRSLCPPHVMASMMVGLDLHPMWGLRVAHHVRAPERSVQFRDTTLFPRTTLEHVTTMVFGTIAGAVSVLRQLDPDTTYPVDALQAVLASSAHAARHAVMEHVGPSPVPVFLSDTPPAFADSFHADVIEGVLVPAGVARRSEDGRLQVRSTWLQDVRVGHLSHDEVEAWGAWHDVPSTCRCAC